MNKYTVSIIRIYNHTQIWIAHINHLSVSFSSSNGSKKSFLDLVPQGHTFMQVCNVVQQNEMGVFGIQLGGVTFGSQAFVLQWNHHVMLEIQLERR